MWYRNEKSATDGTKLYLKEVLNNRIWNREILKCLCFTIKELIGLYRTNPTLYFRRKDDQLLLTPLCNSVLARRDRSKNWSVSWSVSIEQILPYIFAGNSINFSSLHSVTLHSLAVKMKNIWLDVEVIFGLPDQTREYERPWFCICLKFDGGWSWRGPIVRIPRAIWEMKGYFLF